MRLLPGLRDLGRGAATPHQGGWDEILLFVGAPVTMFVVLRWLGIRKERREQREREDRPQADNG